MILAAQAVAWLVLLFMAAYTLRHLLFALNRLFRRPRMNYADLAGFHLPTISVLIPMHNEEAVAPDVLEALLESDYPRDRLEILPINDRSTDGTGEILDDYAARCPWIRPVHRRRGPGGKPAALAEATRRATGEILVIFDADYIPGRSLLKFLAAPFADPQVGAVMGRVVPHNVGSSLLTRLLDLERGGGYQTGQQARHNLGLIPQYGGTVGGVRRAALDAVGGWNAGSLAEDTDLTLRLAIQGWQVVYLNRAECYEEVPVTWEARRKQIERWAVGHTECLHRYLGPLLRSPHLSRRAKLDGALLLGVYLTGPLVGLGWAACLFLFLSGQNFLPALTSFFLASACYSAVGNLAAFFEIGSSVILDGGRRRVLLLPLNLVNFFFSAVTVTLALAKYYLGRITGSGISWEKTVRYRNGGGGRAGGEAPGAEVPAGSYSSGRGLNFIRACRAVENSTTS